MILTILKIVLLSKVSYHYKESGRLFCSGIIINQFWTVSVPNCFHIPTYYYRNKENKRRKRDVHKYPYGNLSLEESATVKPRVYSKTEIQDLRKVFVLNPATIVILTVFDKAYRPCKSQDVRTGRKILVHQNYRIPSHSAEIALVKVSDSLTKGFEIKIPNIAPIKLEQYTSCQVVGYGSMKLNRSHIFYQPMISSINVEVFPPSKCKKLAKTYNVVIDANTNDYVCSYNIKYRYGSPLSQGDSGAPLICHDSVVGIAQWVFSDIPGFLSLGPSQPTPHLYTKIYNYRDWIFQIVNRSKELVSVKKAFIKKNNDSSIRSAYNMRILVFICYILYYIK